MAENKSRFRQIHLDFHTSEKIKDVGIKFDPEKFVDTLKKARVDSINLFLRCHHGMLYYYSQKFPERVHPNLKNKNLLKEQIEACRKNDIAVNLYTTVLWDHYTAALHPEWICITPDGKYSDYKGNGQLDPGFYKNLCINSPYRQFLKEHLIEALEMFEVNGIWLDATFVVECCCEHCLKGMKEAGLDPLNPLDRKKYAIQVYYDFVKEMTGIVKQYNKDYTIFYNKSHVGTIDHPVLDDYSYVAIESIPGGAWGYMDFPVSVRYNRTMGLECVGMTGRFHNAWGDFHSLKNQHALEYECFQMLAQGAKCLIGDQLEPAGELSESVYDLIGNVYAQVEEKEPWCVDAKPVTEIGVFTPEEFYGASEGNLPEAAEGICRMLQEAGQQFDFIDSTTDFSAYKVLIMPDVIPVSDELAEKLSRYLADGGAVIASYESGLNLEKSKFAFSEIGAEYKGEAYYQPDFILPEGKMVRDLKPTEYVMYMRGTHIDTKPNTEILSNAIAPLFNRTFEHFTSHEHAPSSGKVAYPAIIKNNNVIYFMHPIFTQYQKNAAPWVKKLFLNALSIVLPEPLLQHDGPSTLIASVNEQAKENRRIVHLLHYIPERRSETLDVIEDVIPLYDLKVSVQTPRKVKSVKCVPQNIEIDFAENGGRIEFTVDKVVGHQMVSLEYETED